MVMAVCSGCAARTQKRSVEVLTAVATCLAQLVISSRAACKTVMDHRGMDLIIAMLKAPVPEISSQVRVGNALFVVLFCLSRFVLLV